MRTTVNIDDDVLNAAKSLSRGTGRSLGTVLSELARRGLQPREPGEGHSLARDGALGIPLFPVRPHSPIVTPEQIKDALDEGW